MRFSTRFLIRSTTLILLLAIGENSLKAQPLPISDQFSLCATVDSRSSDVHLEWTWAGDAGQSFGYSVFPSSGNFLTINNPNQNSISFTLEKNQIRSFYVLRQAADGQVHRSNDVWVQLKKTSPLAFLIPGLIQSKNRRVISSNCAATDSRKRLGIDQPLLAAFGVSVLSWGGFLVAKEQTRRSRRDFLTEIDTRYTADAFEKWQNAYDLQRTFRDVAVVATVATYALHFISVLRSRNSSTQPRIIDLSGPLAGRHIQTDVKLAANQKAPTLSINVRF